MERLTYKEGNHYYFANDCLVGISTIDEDSLNVLQNVLDKLGAYEDAEEQGLILPAPLDDVESFSLDGKTTWYKSPCRVGDTVYMIDGATSRGYDWKYFTYEKAYVRETIFTIESINSFGKTIFLTRDEAEAKLAEMEGGLKSVETGEIG